VKLNTGEKKCHLAKDKAALAAVQERCTRLHALTVVVKLKYLSNLQREGLFSAKNASRNTGNSRKRVSLSFSKRALNELLKSKAFRDPKELRSLRIAD